MSRQKGWEKNILEPFTKWTHQFEFSAFLHMTVDVGKYKNKSSLQVGTMKCTL